MIEKIAYRICMKDPPEFLDVEGEPIGDGQFAVRMVSPGMWKVDHVDSGFATTGGSTKRNAINNHRALLEEKGERELQKAIRKAMRFLKKADL